MKVKVFPVVLLSLGVLAAYASAGVRGTAHDFVMRIPELSGYADKDLCRFCHLLGVPGPTATLPPLYNLYQSPTLRAVVQQPNGSSRDCLVCHDGAFALGSIWASYIGRRLPLGPVSERVSLGGDLSDDHPVSFVYDSSLARRKSGLADPSTLPRQVRLDSRGRLQCTTCHNPHEERFSKFLVVDNSVSQLCTSCHRFQSVGSSYHTSTNTACGSCHRVHGGSDRFLTSSLRRPR